MCCNMLLLATVSYYGCPLFICTHTLFHSSAHKEAIKSVHSLWLDLLAPFCHFCGSLLHNATYSDVIQFIHSFFSPWLPYQWICFGRPFMVPLLNVPCMTSSATQVSVWGSSNKWTKQTRDCKPGQHPHYYLYYCIKRALCGAHGPCRKSPLIVDIAL